MRREVLEVIVDFVRAFFSVYGLFIVNWIVQAPFAVLLVVMLFNIRAVSSLEGVLLLLLCASITAFSIFLAISARHMWGAVELNVIDIREYRKQKETIWRRYHK